MLVLTVEEAEERDEDVDVRPVPVKCESYVHLKKMASKHSQKLDVLQENKKLCRAFQKKQVKKKKEKHNTFCFIKSFKTSCFVASPPFFFFFYNPVVQALQVHAGAEEEPPGLAGKREHSGRAGAVPGPGDQWDDWVGAGLGAGPTLLQFTTIKI